MLERVFLQVLKPERRDRAIGVGITLEKNPEACRTGTAEEGASHA